MSKKPKIFCIGWHKTGTSSLGIALGMLGYHYVGWRDPITADLTYRWHEGRIIPIIAEAARFDAFEDWPWPLVYREMDKAFAGAKFILTTRKDDAVWLRSAQGHMSRNDRWVGRFLIYGSYDPVADADIHLARYQAHNAAVREYFAGRDKDFLEMCFENGDGWSKLCQFLGKPVPGVSFPHANKSPERTRSEDQSIGLALSVRPAPIGRPPRGSQ